MPGADATGYNVDVSWKLPAFVILCHAYAVLTHSAGKAADLLRMGRDGDSQHSRIVGPEPTSNMAGAE